MTDLENELLNITESVLCRLLSLYKRKQRRGRALDQLHHLEAVLDAITIARLNPVIKR
jgi:hypothetical protein